MPGWMTLASELLWKFGIRGLGEGQVPDKLKRTLKEGSG